MPTTSGSLLVAGTASDAGKSVITAGICRWLARQGVRVAPFKAQNMSNNSMVAPDGAEIGRAQAMQAAAAGVPAEAAMNPVLLKPGSNLRSQVVLLGRAVGETSVTGYWGSGEGRTRLLGAVLDAYDDLRSRFDVVICEGAGSPAEINLRPGNIVNMGLARARKLPVIVVGDIDRGGVFAALYGTLALLDAADQSHLSGFVINKFRGHRELLDPALTQIGALTGRPVLGVLPYLDGIWIDAEDAVATERPYAIRPAGGRGATAGDMLRVAVIRLPRISNFTDIDALALEPGVAVRFVTTPAEIADANLVVVPGTRATVADLSWLRGQGLDGALKRRAADRKPILAICGGYQMLGTVIHDDVESASQRGRRQRRRRRRLRRPGPAAGGHPLRGRQDPRPPGRVRRVDPGLRLRDPPRRGRRPRRRAVVHQPAGRELAGSGHEGSGTALDGCRYGAVSGTLWHGILENDDFRRAYLTETARLAGRNFAPAPDTSFAAARQAQFDTLANAVEEHLDTAALLRLIEQGPTPRPARPSGPDCELHADWPLAGGIAAGVLADAVVGDPRRGHPVALFGRAAAILERGLYADAKTRGVVFTACCEALAIGPALAAARITRHRPLARLAWAGTVTWAVTGARSLTAEAGRVHRALLAGDLPGARRLLPNLVGRDPAGLDAAGIARAVVESVAENTSDAIVAPLLWGALAGPAGAGRLPGRQHPRRHGRASLAALPAVRLGLRPPRQRGQLGPRPRHRPAGGGLRPRRRRPPGRRLADRARLRAPASEPERRLVRGGVRGRARRPARRAAQLRGPGRAAARARRRPPAGARRHRPRQPPVPVRDRGRDGPRRVPGAGPCCRTYALKAAAAVAR